MAELGPVTWPPDPIRTARLVLRESQDRDRPVFAEVERFHAWDAEQWVGERPPGRLRSGE